MRYRIAPLLLATILVLPSAGRANDGDSPGGTALIGAEEGTAVEGPKVCGDGTKTMCGKTTSQKCLEWKLTSTTLGGNYGIGTGGLTGSMQYTCANWLTVELTLYKNP